MRWSVALLLLAVGCKGTGEAGESQEAGAGAARKDAAAGSGMAPDEAPREVTGADLDALERPPRVPALSFTRVSAAAKSRARSHNAAGLALYGARKYREAIDKYIAALEADPGHILARYNLSCAYNLVGEPEKGLALLNELRQRGCAECRERLVRASEDADWHSMWDHPLFVEIVGVPIGGAEAQVPFWKAETGCPAGTKLIGKVNAEVYCARGAVRHGPFARWHAAQGAPTLAETGEFENGERSGLWKIFDAGGWLRETGPYRGGQKSGAWSEWYESGSQAVDGRFVGGQRHGRWTWFEESGAIIKQADYVRDKREPWIVAPKK